MIPSASYPGKKTSLNQFSKYIPPSEKKTGLRPSWFLCCAALHWAGAPGRLGSYRMKPTSLKWNKNLKKFVKTQGHNLKMSFLRPNLWIGPGFWVKKQIILWFLTWNVLTIFFWERKANFSWLWTWFKYSRQGQRASHCHLTKNKKLRAVFFWAFKAQGTSGMIPM